jgi:DNA replication and repair protein RecF
MYLKKLKVSNFKNYATAEIHPSSAINVFTGPNGSGKTNLLDAIYLLSITKSAFNNNDASIIRKGEEYFRVEGIFEKTDKEYLVEVAFSRNTKKIIKTDKIDCEKIKDHIGQFPVILVTPYDTDVIREGSEERRKFFDSVFSQLDSTYLNELIKYNSVLKQRNSLLKQFYEQNYIDEVLISAYNFQLIDSGKKIFTYRKKFIKELIPVFHYHFESLTGKKEKIDLIYESQLENENFQYEFEAGLRQDIALQRTSKGIHKDDYAFIINDSPLKSFGSQGQQKSYVIALKLAQFDLIKLFKGIKPIILLDDIFDKLDDDRIKKLLEMVIKEEFGQLFITDARVERTLQFFKDLKTKIRIFNVESGSISELISKI